jgi:hypothetical protein
MAYTGNHMDEKVRDILLFAACLGLLRFNILLYPMDTEPYMTDPIYSQSQVWMVDTNSNSLCHFFPAREFRCHILR